MLGLWRFLAVQLALSQLLLLSLVEAQIRVQSPKSLQEKLRQIGATSPETQDVLVGSTAAFGTPVYGTVLRGRAFYVADPPRVESDGRDGGVHCGPSYCENIKSKVLEWKEQQTHGGLGKAFFFVDRGVCTFAAKVAVAEGCGADAVVVVDHGSQNWSRETIQHNVVMSDDGQARKVSIPSILISREDGDLFKAAIESGEEVLIELEWQMPALWPVQLNIWSDAADPADAALLQGLAPYLLRLGGQIRVQVFFNVFALDGGSDDLCLTEGIYKSFPKLYCGFEPSAQIGKSGREVVEQSLLQSCIFDATKRADPAIPQSEFSARFWNIQHRLADKENGCHMGAEGENAWGLACTRRVMQDVLSTSELRNVEACFEGEKGRRLLEKQKNSRAWSLAGVTVNGARYSGILEAEAVLRAVCSAARHPVSREYRAKECTDIVVEAHRSESPWLSDSPDWSSLLLVLFLAAVVCLGLTCAYWRRAKRQLHQGVQQQVQQEVRQQMQHYRRIEEPAPLSTQPEKVPFV